MNYTSWGYNEPKKEDSSPHAVVMDFFDDETPLWFGSPVTRGFFPLCEK
jgi:hypothetical protein